MTTRFSPSVQAPPALAASPEGPSDVALMAALTRGDKSALGRLYDRHAGLLLALGLRILGDRGRTEDVVHDVFLEAWHHALDFDPSRGSVRAWLVTRMRSRALDRRTAIARQMRLCEEAGHDAERSGGFAQADAAPLDADRLRAHILGLAPELGAVIELSYFEGLSSSQIATRLQIPIGTVKSRMARALGTLREGLNAATEAT